MCTSPNELAPKTLVPEKVICFGKNHGHMLFFFSMAGNFQAPCDCFLGK